MLLTDLDCALCTESRSTPVVVVPRATPVRLWQTATPPDRPMCIHSQSGRTGYAFELLFNKRSWSYRWSSLCSSNSLALLNPLHSLDTYTDLGYIPDSPTIPKASISNFKPTPGFLKLVSPTSQVTTTTFLVDESEIENVVQVPDTSALETYGVACGVAVAVAGIVVVVVIAVVRKIKRERLARMYGNLEAAAAPVEDRL